MALPLRLRKKGSQRAQYPNQGSFKIMRLFREASEAACSDKTRVRECWEYALALHKVDLHAWSM